MHKIIFTAIATVFAANLAQVAHAQSIAFSNGVMTDNAGRTLYTFDKDAANKSNCYDGCAAAWPPFFAKDGAGANAGFSVIARDDGSKQWAMNGKPLYYYAPDTQPGDVKGDKQGGVWHVIRNAEQRAQAQPAARQPAAGYGSYNYGGSGY